MRRWWNDLAAGLLVAILAASLAGRWSAPAPRLYHHDGAPLFIDGVTPDVSHPHLNGKRELRQGAALLFEVGATYQEVEAALGRPLVISGNTWVYSKPWMEVDFTDSKVSSFQYGHSQDWLD